MVITNIEVGTVEASCCCFIKGGRLGCGESYALVKASLF